MASDVVTEDERSAVRELVELAGELSGGERSLDDDSRALSARNAASLWTIASPVRGVWMSMQTQRGCRPASGSGDPVAARAVVADMGWKCPV